MRRVVIGKNDQDQRLDRFIEKYLPKASYHWIQKMIRIKKIKRNKKRAKAEDILKEGDVLSFYIYEEDLQVLEEKIPRVTSKIPLHFVYENEDFAVLNKPRSLLCHPASKKDYGQTLIDAFVDHLIQKKEYIPHLEKSFRPSLVNRLDFHTQGLVLAAKNHKALFSLNQAMKERKIEKYYRAFVKGKIDQKLVIDKALYREDQKIIISDKGKASRTIVKPLDYNEKFSYLDIKLETGRFHQIRAHLASIGHPLIGDGQFGERSRSYFSLLSYKLVFLDIPNFPFWKNMEFLSPSLKEFENDVRRHL